MELQIADERSRLYQEINRLRAVQVRNDRSLREVAEDAAIQRIPIDENVGQVPLRRREASPSTEEN